MHLVANYDKAPFAVPPTYEQHSKGYTRIALVDHTIPGAVHTGLGLCRLEAGGILNPHVHFYEEAFFILEGQVLERIEGHDYRLGPGDYGIIQSGVSHALRNSGDQPVRWLEMLSPQPKSPNSERDTFFFKSEGAPITGTPPDFRDPMTRYLGHFDDSQMPPYSLLQMEGYRGSSIAGISLKMLVDHMLGAQHLTLFMVEFQPGGAGNIHDHPFEESYFFLSGEAEAILDGKTYHVKAGDYVWTGVGGTHGFFNKGAVPMRWIETQTPQPPNQQGFRFPADWAYLAKKLEAQDAG
ncbi:MAG TPA: cupin domain-containing protein [Ktedonobacteraceae bacterium]|nr:cupin domain-containing protein [Ktedonobacteraceae bacterium]